MNQAVMAPINIPGFSILELLDERGNVRVFRAVRKEAKQRVVLKVLEDNELAHIGRLEQEYEIIRSLKGDSLLKALDLEIHTGRQILVLDDINGRSLTHFLGGLDLREALTIFVSAARQLHLIHASKVIHQDINPCNIVLERDSGRLQIIDFSISRRSGGVRHRMSGRLKGTLPYISPEQTGRLGRQVDFRSDFYSFGVTMYRVLADRLPFDEEEPMKMVHCHIARVPKPVHEVNPAIPRIVSDLVARLMEKNAEDRYQSAHGLLVDLEQCLEGLKPDDTIEPFTLGTRDQSSELRVTGKLYGREFELAELMATFEKVTAGSLQVMLLSGPSGVGKTALIREIRAPLLIRSGFFISGKSDLQHRNIPYAPVIQAFRMLARQLLSESPERLERLGRKLVDKLGSKLGLILEVIPEIKWIAKTDVPELPAAENENRTRLAFRDLFSVFASREHPLVLFLDDLQWIDPASSRLLEDLPLDTRIESLLVLCSYRQGEVCEAHPLVRTVDELRSSRAEVTEVTISPLTEANVSDMIADTLGCPDRKARELARLVSSRTSGNPLYVAEYLEKLHQEGLIRFNAQAGAWTWDMMGIEAAGSDGDVVDLIAGKINKLSRQVRVTLRLAACMGNQFDLATLALVGEMPRKKTLQFLWPALSEGLLVSLESIEGTGNESALPEDFNPLFEFAHDEIQQACYVLMPEARRRKTHLKIGRHMLGSDSDPDERLFEIVNHLNLGLAFVDQGTEKEQLIRLNLKAGKKARRTSAYATALDYLSVAMELLPRLGWQTHYEITMACYLERASCEQLSGNPKRAGELFEMAVCQAQTVMEMVAIYQMKTELYTQRGLFAEAIESGLIGLDLLEMPLPDMDDKVQDRIYDLLSEVETRIGIRDVPVLAGLSHNEDMQVRLALRLLSGVWAPALNMNRNLMNLASLQMTALSLEHGNSRISACGYAGYGMIVGAVYGNWERGEAFGRLAMDLADSYQDKELSCRVHFLYGAFICPWRSRVRDALPHLHHAYEAGVDSGNLMWAAFCAFHKIALRVFQGDQLSSVYRECCEFSTFLEGTREEQSVAALSATMRMIQMLENVEDTSWDGEGFDDTRFLEKIQRKLHIVALVHYYHVRSLLALIFGDAKLAIRMGERAEQLEAYQFAWPTRTVQWLVLAMAYSRSWDDADEAERKRIRKKIIQYRDRLSDAETSCPANFRARRLLVDAELARLEGRAADAADFYDKAIGDAAGNELIHLEALACELAGRFFQQREKNRVAAVYLKDACVRYVQWGANAKVAVLRREFPELMQNGATEHTSHGATLTSHTRDISQSLDVATFVKASQAITREIKLEPLLEKLLRFSLENAGARRGFLILEHKGLLNIEAEGDVDQSPVTRLARGGVDGHRMAAGLIHYVYHCGESLVLGNASREGHFTNDPYILANQPKSVLCLPIVYQGKKLGVLYLENNLLADAFTRDRLEILNLLAADAAGAIENARLYGNLADAGRKLQESYVQLEEQNRTLEEKVAERTRELTVKNRELEETLSRLQAMQQRIIQQEKLASLGSLTAGIAHEIRNPLNFVNNFSEVSIDLLGELRGDLSRVGDKPPDKAQLQDMNEVIGYLEHNLTRISEHGRRADGIVNSMLRHSHPKNVSDLELWNLEYLVEEFVSLAYQGYKARFPNFTMDIDVKCDQPLPKIPMIRQDISRVIVNMVDNACDAVRTKKERIPGFQGKISLLTTREDDMARITIRDDGNGIPETVLDQIFTPFFTTKPTGEGTGLGLSLSHDIVVAVHGGRIEVESEEGEYTCLTIWLPLEGKAPDDNYS